MIGLCSLFVRSLSPFTRRVCSIHCVFLLQRKAQFSFFERKMRYIKYTALPAQYPSFLVSDLSRLGSSQLPPSLRTIARNHSIPRSALFEQPIVRHLAGQDVCMLPNHLFRAFALGCAPEQRSHIGRSPRTMDE